MSPDVALAFCRFVHDAATMLLFGAFIYLATLVPPTLAAAVGARLTAFRVSAVILAFATTVVALPLETASIGDGWAEAMNPATLGAVLFETSVGRALIAQTALASLLLASLAAKEAWRPGLTALLSGLLLAALALTGHAAMHEGWLGLAHRVNDAVHLLAAGAWLGALVPLVPMLRLLETSSHRLTSAVALRRFSAAGHGAVALAVATGALNSRLVLGRWPLDVTSPYQTLLTTKIVLVAIMTALAIVNRYIHVPRIAQNPSTSLGALRQMTIANVILGLAVIALVSVFGLLEPGSLGADR